MREEVVVYINGQPFVLREAERPFKNMQVQAGKVTVISMSDYTQEDCFCCNFYCLHIGNKDNLDMHI